MAKITNAGIRDFFGMEESAFRSEWAKLDTRDKSQIRGGLDDGTLNY